ncbi:MAG: hypothetical protein C0391_00330 [Anaerolinea sp.]|nr:hypothetical protein [Anaerolinea sp.]
MKKLTSIIFITLLVLLTGCNTSLAGDIKPPADYTPPAVLPPAATAVVYPLVPPDPVAGETVYAEYCASCHGEKGNGVGQKAGNSASSPAALAHPETLRNAIPQDWFAVIKDGSGSMPGFATKLDDRANWNVVAYLLSMENTLEQMSIGAEIFYAVCSQCHGVGGNGNGKRATTLAVTPADFTDLSLMSAISNQGMEDILSGGIGEAMPAFGNMLSEDERWAAIGYIRSLSFAPVAMANDSTVVDDTPDPDAPINVEVTPILETTPVVKLVTITGRIINDSSNTGSSGLKVTLLIFDNMQQSSSLDTIADKNGEFRFEGVEMPTGRIFIASVDYGGQSFSSQPSMHPGVVVDETQTELDLPVHIYDATTDVSVVSADRLHIFMDFRSPGIVQVVALYLISNHSDQVVTASTPGEGVLEFKLPEGAANLQFQDSELGGRYIATEQGFADTAPVMPGEASHQVLFMFDLPYTSRLKLSMPVSINIESINVMIPVGNIKLKSSQLEDAGMRENQGMSFNLFTGGAVAAGGSLEITVTGKSGTQNTTDSQGKVNPILLGPGIFLLAACGVGLYFYQQGKKPVAEGEMADTNLKDKESVMDAIIALDLLHNEGKIMNGVYQIRREELKNKLKGMM